MMMKYIKYVGIVVFFICNLHGASGQIDSLIIEKYYISDSNDALYQFPPLVEATLDEGSVTYRIYIDLPAGQKLGGIFADENHSIRIASTSNFFNFPMFGSNFGYEANSAFFFMGTIALDSYLTLGYTTTTHMGIEKVKDNDGSIIGGPLSGGKLTNTDAEIGESLTEKDGLITSLVEDNNFIDSPEPVAAVFGTETVSNEFLSSAFTLNHKNGIEGDSEDNRVLIAQLTTTGELEFDLNIVVYTEDYDPTKTTKENYGSIIRYVADQDVLIDDSDNGILERYSKFLSYPPKCGCTDPYFVQYDPAAVCDDGSCRDSIIYGCLDPTACNYDAKANFNLPELCCYGPDNCDNRDINIVCPNYNNPDEDTKGAEGNVKNAVVDPILNIFPNPAVDILNIEYSNLQEKPSVFKVYDSYGRLVLYNNYRDEVIIQQIDVSSLNSGLYILHVKAGNQTLMQKFFK